MRVLLITTLLFLVAVVFSSVTEVLSLDHHDHNFPLTEQELTIVQTIVLHKYYYFPTPKNRVAFHYIGLDKEAIYKWELLKVKVKPIFPRKAFVVIGIIMMNGQIQNHKIIVDLRRRFVVSDKAYTDNNNNNGFPTTTTTSLSIEEQVSAIELPHKYPPFIASVNRRGLNLSEVVCSVFCSSSSSSKSSTSTVRVDCFFIKDPMRNPRPIIGIKIVVDLHLQKIVEYNDDNRDIIIAAESVLPTAAATTEENLRPPFGPTQRSLATPQGGGGYQINGHKVRGIVIAIVVVGSLLLLFSGAFLFSAIYGFANNQFCHGGCCH